MPTVYFLIGVPASGKSTWVQNYMTAHGYTRVLSTDIYIEAAAVHEQKTYSEVFREYIDNAEKFLNTSLEDAIDRDVDFIWDQTNLTAKSRAKKLTKIPSNYRKIAVYFRTPKDDEHKRRLDSRPGKVIPKETLDNMIKTIEFPTFEEGFDEIWVEGEYVNAAV